MPNLKDYNIDNLVNRVEGGSDSDGQKAEPILIAKSLLELQESITLLHKQIPLTAVEIKVNLSKNTEKITESMDALKKAINDSSIASSRQAGILNFWTKGLVFATIVLVLVTAIFSYLQYYN